MRKENGRQAEADKTSKNATFKKRGENVFYFQRMLLNGLFLKLDS